MRVIKVSGMDFRAIARGQYYVLYDYGVFLMNGSVTMKLTKNQIVVTGETPEGEIVSYIIHRVKNEPYR